MKLRESQIETLQLLHDAGGTMDGEELAGRIDRTPHSATRRLWRLWPTYVTWAGDVHKPRFSLNNKGVAHLQRQETKGEEAK